MSSLHTLFRALDHLVVSFISQWLPVGKAVPSSCVDIFYGVFLSAVAIGLIQPMSPNTAGFTPPPSERPTIAQTVERFAPEVRLHPEERYFPSSVTWYLERTQMRRAIAGGSDHPTVAAGELHATQLPTLDVKDYRAGHRKPSNYFLQIANDGHEVATRHGKLNTAVVYVHVRKPAHHAKGYDIQYWFFYPYSGPLIGGPVGGAHEGDWEHVTVRVDQSLRHIKKIFYAAHDSEGRWLRPSQIRFQHKTHPVVYSGRWGHASYARPGVHARGMLPADHTADGGAVWQTWKKFKIVADESGPRSGINWLRYAGRWGEVGALFSGPRGPAFQRYWISEK